MSRILANYRNLLRATGEAFKNDIPTLSAARYQVREGFKNEKNATLTEDELNERLAYTNDISVVLRQNIVQGAKDEDTSKERYILNIRKDTELGNNDSIKKGKNTLGGDESGAGGCCGGSGKDN